MQAKKMNKWMRYIWQKRLRGSYTVEASLIVPILLFIIEMTIVLGFKIYSEGISYIEEVQPMEMQSVEMFRMLQAGQDIVEDLVGD